MKFLKKAIVIGIVLLLVLLLGLVLGRNAIARSSIESAVSDSTGFPVSVASVNIPISFNAVDVRGIDLKNPPDFEDKQFIDMPQIEASGGFATLFGTPHINSMTLDLRTLLISRNAKGEWNSQKLAGMNSSGGSKYKIDALHLKIGSVTVRDNTTKPPTEKNYRLDIDSTYKNVTSANDVMRLIFFSLLMKGKIPDIGLSAGDIAKNLGGITDAAGGLLNSAEGLIDMGKGLFGGKKK
jgi:hypothetical protein